MTQAWLPCARGLPLATLAGAAALAAAPTVLTLLRGGHDLGGALVAAALVAGAAAAFTVDDPAEETLAASPTSLARRRVLRLGAIVLGVAGVAAVLVAVALAGDGAGGPDLDRRAAELGATSGLAAVAAGKARRMASAGAAHGGAVVGVVSVLLVSAFGYRYHWLPTLVDSPRHARWWLLAAGGWAIAAWTWRDPAR